MKIFGNRMRKYVDFKGQEIVPFGTPIPLHGVNPRNMMNQKSWDKIRKESYKKHDYKCAICGESGLDQGYDHPVEAHEIWDYDFDTLTQHFEGVISLCPTCHKVIHWDQNRMMLNSGSITHNEFARQQEMKEQKLYDLYGKDALFNPIFKERVPWHRAEWKSDFSKLKELYPDVHLYKKFDTHYNGVFKRDSNSYVYKKTDEELYKKGF